MNGELDERAFLAALDTFGLKISMHDVDGWGYTWLYGEWVGPFSSPLAATHAGFTAALLALSVAPVSGPADKEEVQALLLVQRMRHAAEEGKLQEGRIAHVELNHVIERWAEKLDGRINDNERV